MNANCHALTHSLSQRILHASSNYRLLMSSFVRFGEGGGTFTELIVKILRFYPSILGNEQG